MKRRALAALAAVLLVPLAACDDDAKAEKPAEQKIERPAELHPAWSTKTPTPFLADRVGFQAEGALTTWRVGERVIVLGETRATAYQRHTGQKVWTVDFPKSLGSVCAASESTNTTGVAAVMFSRSRTCTGSLGALDAAGGKLLWHRSLADAEQFQDDVMPSITDQTLTLAPSCEDLQRYAVRTGAPLGNPLGDRAGCHDHVALRDDIVVASRTDPATGEDSIEAYDTDTARRLWSTPRTDGARVLGVVSTEPLILDLELDGRHRVQQRYDDQGRARNYVAYESNDDSPNLLGVFGDQLVASYGYGSPLGNPIQGFSVTTGERTWSQSRESSATIAGRLGSDIITIRRVSPETRTDDVDSGRRTDEFWVGTFDPAEPDRRIAYGRIRVQPEVTYPLFLWADGQLYVHDGRTLSAYDLPSDPGRPMPAYPDPGAPQWATGDITYADVADVCLAIRDASLRRLHFRTDLPRPSGCQWSESEQPVGVEATLSVEVFVLTPERGEDGPTATEEAVRQATQWREDKDNNYVAPMKAVAGIGDEAWQATKSRRQSVTTRLIARERNLVVIAHYEGRGGDVAPDAAVVRRQVQQVVREVLGAPDLG